MDTVPHYEFSFRPLCHTFVRLRPRIDSPDSFLCEGGAEIRPRALPRLASVFSTFLSRRGRGPGSRGDVMCAARAMLGPDGLGPRDPDASPSLVICDHAS